MPKRIHIGALTFATNNATLNTAFSPYGTIVSLAVNLGPTGQSLGHADGEYTTEAAGTAAIAAMNGAVIDGATITVAEGR